MCWFGLYDDFVLMNLNDVFVDGGIKFVVYVEINL